MDRAEQSPKVRSNTLLKDTQKLLNQGPPHYLNRTGLRSCFVTSVMDDWHNVKGCKVLICFAALQLEAPHHWS